MSDKPDFSTQPQRIIDHILYVTKDYDHPENWFLETWLNRTTISYAFPTTAPTRGKGEEAGFVYFDSYLDPTYRAFELWDELIAINLAPTTSSNANITVAFSSTTSGNGSYTSGTTRSIGEDKEILAGRIWLSINWAEFQVPLASAAPSPDKFFGRKAFQTLVHEIGHSLGLNHPGPYDASDNPPPDSWANAAKFQQDTLQYSVMSYWYAGDNGNGADWKGNFPSTPMVFDIAAIQQKYGADTQTRKGNTTYGFHASADINEVYDFTHYDTANGYHPVLSIYDAGGVDTLDVSGYNANAQLIDLRPGAYSSVGPLKLNIGIALNTIIENAVGGAMADTIIGNNADNVLEGGGGGDSLAGLGGFDYASYAGAGAGVLADLALAFQNTGDAAGDQYSSIEGLIGSAFADTLRGDSGINILRGGGGNDLLAGRDGVNTLYGEAGNDTFIGREGNDRFDGGPGVDLVSYESSLGPVRASLWVGGWFGDALADTYIKVENLRGSNFDDVLSGDQYANRLEGGDGNDSLDGSDGPDSLAGGEGNDTLFGGFGADSINGGPGIDLVDYSSTGGPVRVMLAPAFDAYGNLILSGGQAAGDRFLDVENVIGTVQADTIYGNAADNTFVSGGGWDELRGRGGNDTYDIGAIEDVAILGKVWDEVIEAPGEGFDTVLINSSYSILSGLYVASYTLPANVEAVIAKDAGNYTLVGNVLDNWLEGNGGIDRLVAGDGADTLQGGLGADTLFGEYGDDTYILLDATALTPPPGYIYPVAWTWDLVLEPVNGGRDTVIVGSPAHPLFPGSYITSYTLGSDIENGVVWSTRDFTLVGNVLANSLTGGDGNDVLIAGDSGDTLTGGFGADTLYGEYGDDVYILRDVATPYAPPGSIALEGWDVILEAAAGGTDTVLVERAQRAAGFGFWRNDYTLAQHVENGIVTGDAAFTLSGNALANRLTGNAAFNFLLGQDGADTLEGMGGGDALNGGADNDRLSGGAGADTLDGGSGRDTLIGGTEADVFVFSLAPLTAAFDVVSDFAPGEDLVLIGLAAFDPAGTSGLVAGSLAVQPGRFSVNDTGLPTGAGVAQFVYESDLGRLWFDIDGAGGQSRQLVASFAGLPALTAADILLA